MSINFDDTTQDGAKNVIIAILVFILIAFIFASISARTETPDEGIPYDALPDYGRLGN